MVDGEIILVQVLSNKPSLFLGIRNVLPSFRNSYSFDLCILHCHNAKLDVRGPTSGHTLTFPAVFYAMQTDTDMSCLSVREASQGLHHQ